MKAKFVGNPFGHKLVAVVLGTPQDLALVMAQSEVKRQKFLALTTNLRLRLR